jgi:hypothetical protein
MLDGLEKFFLLGAKLILLAQSYPVLWYVKQPFCSTEKSLQL